MNRTLLGFSLLSCGLLAAQPPGGSGDGIWSRNAAFGEIETFDYCNGHQPQTGMYHNHINPICLRAQLSDSVTAVYTGRLGTRYAENTSGLKHSPILGWAYDGYPIYGPYGYSNPNDATSAIKRLVPGFQLRSISQRHSLPTWVLPYHPSVSQTLTSNQYGPDVSATYPLGRYVEDYDYVAGAGDLDQYNGRFTVTPDYPGGTYAYFVTVAADGTPQFPYIINVQLYGTLAGGNAQTVASDVVDYFANGALKQSASTDPLLAAWYTKGSQQDAKAITGFDPSAGATVTWPTNVPSGVSVNGGNSAPALADAQRIRYDSSAVYVNSNDLPSYTIGPWFEATMTGGVFMNWASSSALQVKFPRGGTAASTKVSSGMGPVGIWINGVAIFNVLDGGSYSNAQVADVGGGGISLRATHVSSASGERGPLAAGSLASAYAEFTASLGGGVYPATLASGAWPTSLGGTTVTVTDSSGKVTTAGILYVSPAQVNYQVPNTVSSGVGKVTITSSGASVNGTVNLTATYPGLFTQSSAGLAAGQTVTVNGTQQTVATIDGSAITLGANPVYLVLYGTGIGNAAATATVGGVNATVAYAGAQGVYPGLDQINVLIPGSLAGKGQVGVVVTAANKPSNPVYVVVQ